jgi:RNA polymerase sigma-70 factor (ECF subfamily)
MDQEELTATIRESEGRLRRYITRLIGSVDEVDDLLQETFTRAHSGRDNFRGESRGSTWLYSIASNVCLDYLKSAGRRRLVVTPPEVLEGIAKEGEAEDGPRLSVTLLLDQAEMGSCVRRLIEELPDNLRMALILHDIEEMTNAEVASALGCSVANAKIRVHRARQKLRDALETKCVFGRDARGVFVCEPKRRGQPPSA